MYVLNSQKLIERRKPSLAKVINKKKKNCSKNLLNNISEKRKKDLKKVNQAKSGEKAKENSMRKKSIP